MYPSDKSIIYPHKFTILHENLHRIILHFFAIFYISSCFCSNSCHRCFLYADVPADIRFVWLHTFKRFGELFAPKFPTLKQQASLAEILVITPSIRPISYLPTSPKIFFRNGLKANIVLFII